MTVIPMHRLRSEPFTASGIFVRGQDWRRGDRRVRVEGRICHGLIYFCGCSADYRLPDGRSVRAVPGDILYLPKLSNYAISFSDVADTTPSSILVNFGLADVDGNGFAFFETVERVCPSESGSYTELLFRRALELSRAGDVPLLYSEFYKLLSALISGEYSRSLLDRRFEKIAPGIKYLETDPDGGLPVSGIAALCSVSETCFRRLFKLYSGTTPTEFRIQKKIGCAKRLLETDAVTVAEVSELLGFEDAAYFSRLFKSRTGVAPARYPRGGS